MVDCDTAAAAEALELRFPELKDVPMEATARGRHYFFARSPLSDAHGYYDGAAQRAPAVDFKTRAWGGGSGFVVTAPSTNKVRACANMRRRRRIRMLRCCAPCDALCVA